MNDLITLIINWSEAWSLLIPITVILFCKPTGPGVPVLIAYVISAFVINVIATSMWEFHISMPDWLQNNNIFYNIHSFIKVMLFCWYIIIIRQYHLSNFLKAVLVAYIVFVIINFGWLQSPLYFSNYALSAESIVLLIFSFSFFFRSMLDESEINWLRHPAFLVCTGISLYEATCFFIFLFFYPLTKAYYDFADMTMSIHNMTYVVLCILLAIALYKDRSSQKTAI